jgi:hypothetical protein
MSESIGKLSGGSTPPLHPGEPMPPSDANEVNFITFTVRIPKESLSPNTVQQAIQSKISACEELNQFKVSVEQKIIVPNTEWQPTCQDMIGDINRPGECLFNALYKAGLDINVARGLRKKIVERELNDLMSKCKALDQKFDANETLRKTTIANSKQEIKNIFDGLTPEEELQRKFCGKALDSESIDDIKSIFRVLNDAGIDDTVRYMSDQNINDMTDITGVHLREIFCKLGMPDDHRLFSNMANDGGKVFPNDDGRNHEEEIKDVARVTCLKLSNIIYNEKIKSLNQKAIDHNRLLNVIESLSKSGRLSLKGSRATLNIINDTKTLKKIRDTYNENLEGNPMVENDTHIISHSVRAIIFLAVDLLATNANEYTSLESLKYIVNEIKRPVFLVKAEEIQSFIPNECYEDNEIQGGTLYNLDGSRQKSKKKISLWRMGN